MTYFIVFCHHIINPNVFEVRLLREDCVSILSGSASNFFLPTTSSPLTGFARVASFRSRAIEGWRRVVRSMPMCIAVGVYTYGICVEDMYRVCLRGIRMDVTLGWSIGVRYIYLISVILNVCGGYNIYIIRSQHDLLYLFHTRIYR